MRRSRSLSSLYLIVSLVVLGTTTIYWSIIGAFIQSQNADQIANSFLFENSDTLRHATFPFQHTFLLKTPLFLLTSGFNNEPFIIILVTVLLCLLTVFGLVIIISYINRQPYFVGTICLALAASLLFIPAQSYPGSILPANFAMITTRNVEYIVFIGALILLLKITKIKHYYFGAAILLLSVLFASDRLFVYLSAGTAVISALLFALSRRRDLIRYSGRLLVASIISFAVATLALIVLEKIGFHTDSGSPAGPYEAIDGVKSFGIAIIYAGMGIVTNLGANPVFNTLIVRDIPMNIIKNIVSSPIGVGYVITAAIAVVCVISMFTVFKTGLKVPLERKGQRHFMPWQMLLAPTLVATTVTALAIYIFSNHYYPADSRYLAIVIFAAFISVATVYRQKKIAPARLVRVGVVCSIGIIFGILFQAQNLQAQNNAMNEITHRNALVSTAMASHPTGSLLGNYWRVLPIKSNSPAATVTPLEACTTLRQVLSSTAWQPDLKKTSFAYLLRLDGGLAGFPTCTLNDITKKYGRPDSSVVIAGTRADPKEVLLFYDEGIHFLKTPAANNTTVDTVRPISVDIMPFTTCATKTIMQFVAHEDDDILFMNPDVSHDIKNGNCIRTVFFTAGDAGADKLYWLGRQKGAEEAYNAMLGTPGATWTERIVSVDGTHTITVANPRGNHRISLVFLHLPDGNPEGSGFASKGYESLKKLAGGNITSLHPVDDSHESYSSSDLTGTLAHLMNVYKPAEVRSQSTYSGATIKDHSDHNAVGEFAGRAFATYKESNPKVTITYYMGYPIHTLPANVVGEDYDNKVNTFLTFGHYDGATCHSLAECNNNSVYGNYLERQYTYPY